MCSPLAWPSQLYGGGGEGQGLSQGSGWGILSPPPFSPGVWLTLLARGSCVAIHAEALPTDRVAVGPTPTGTGQGTAGPEKAHSAVCRREGRRDRPECQGTPGLQVVQEQKPQASVSLPCELSHRKAPATGILPRITAPCSCPAPGLANGGLRVRNVAPGSCVQPQRTATPEPHPCWQLRKVSFPPNGGLFLGPRPPPQGLCGWPEDGHSPDNTSRSSMLGPLQAAAPLQGDETGTAGHRAQTGAWHRWGSTNAIDIFH